MQGFTVFCLTVMRTNGDYGIIGRKYIPLCLLMLFLFNYFYDMKQKNVCL